MANTASTSFEINRLFRRGFGITLALDLVARAVSAVTVVVLVRGLSTSAFAFVTLFLTLAQLIGSAVTGGIRTWYMRVEAESYSKDAGVEQRSAFVQASKRGLVLIVLASLASIPVAIALGFATLEDAPILLLCVGLYAGGSSLIELAMTRYQARRGFTAAGILGLIRSLALLLVAVVVTVTSSSDLAVSIWFGVTMAAAGCLALRVGVGAGGGAHGPTQRAHVGEELWLTLFYVAAAGFAYVDVLIAGAMLDDESVASLGAALRYLAILMGAMPALGAILRVRAAQVDLIDSEEAQRRVLLAWMRRTSVPVVGFALAAILLAPWVIPRIDDGRYPDSVIILQIFVVTVVAAYLSAPATGLLIARRAYRPLALIFIVGFLANVVADVGVAPFYGVVGIAVVSSVIYVGIYAVVTVVTLRPTNTLADD